MTNFSDDELYEQKRDLLIALVLLLTIFLRIAYLIDPLVMVGLIFFLPTILIAFAQSLQELNVEITDAPANHPQRTRHD